MEKVFSTKALWHWLSLRVWQEAGEVQRECATRSCPSSTRCQCMLTGVVSNLGGDQIPRETQVPMFKSSPCFQALLEIIPEYRAMSNLLIPKFSDLITV